MRLQELAHQFESIQARRTHQHNGQITRDTKAPEIPLSTPIVGEDARWRAACRLVIEQRTREPTVELSLRLFGAKMPQRDQAMRPRKFKHTIRHRLVLVFL